MSVLTKLAGGSGDTAFSAEIVIGEWDKGTLQTSV